MKKVLIALFAISLVPNISFAGPKAEVLHWWTSGGEAKALSVLKADFAAKGGVWTDMPVAGGPIRTAKAIRTPKQTLVLPVNTQQLSPHLDRIRHSFRIASKFFNLFC